ncbi:MAG: hypothetical protein SGILL_000104 [Bacillariaceae sp.]
MKRPRSSVVPAASSIIVNSNSNSTTSIGIGTDSSSDTPLKKRSDLGVRISEKEHTVIGTSDTTADETSVMWYVQQELDVFRKQARDYVLGRSTNTDSETRGYERYNVVRSKQKAMTRKVTLLACSQKALSPEDVAVVIGKATQWAVKDAFRAACSDYCAAYLPEMASATDRCDKRSLEQTEQERNVRQRTVC